MRRGGAILLGLSAAVWSAAATAAPAPKPPAAAPAGSSTSVSGSPGFAGNQPVDITADSLDSFREQHLTIYKGNVEAIQGNARIRTPQLDIYSAAKPNNPNAPSTPGQSFGGIERMEAAGPVYYVTPTETAKGDHGTYLKLPDTITLTGNVILTQDKNVLTGEKLVIEQKTGHSTLTNNSGRVRTIIYPQQATPPGQAKPGTPGAPAPASAAPKKKRS